LPVAVVLDGLSGDVSMKTLVDGDDMAEMISFFTSPAGKRISSQALSVDGHTESIN
jgi:hypothetical protein